MDKIDRGILHELKKDSQAPFVKIAKQQGISPETARKRYKLMLKEGTIKRCSVQIDLSKLGYQGKVFLMITNAPNQDKLATINALRNTRNVIVVSEIIGDFDLLAIAPIRDFNDINALVSEVKKIPSVSRVEVTLTDDKAFPVSQRYSKISEEKQS